MRSNNLDAARVSCKDIVECNVKAIGSRYKSYVTQLAALSEMCVRRHYTEKECVEFVDVLVSSSRTSYLYGGYVRLDGSVISTNPADTVNVIDKKFAMTHLSIHGKPFMITPPKPDPSNPRIRIQNLLVPVREGDKVKGALYVAMNTNSLLEVLSSIKSNGMGEAYLCNVEGALVVGADTVNPISFTEPVKEICKLVAARINGGMNVGGDSFEGSDREMRLVTWARINDSRWFIMMEILYDDLDKSRARMRNYYIAAGFIVFVIVMIYVYLITKIGIVNPLVRLKKVVNEFAAGRMYNAVKIDSGVSSEIGLLYDDVSDMAKKIIKITDNIRSQSDAIVVNGHELNDTADFHHGRADDIIYRGDSQHRPRNSPCFRGYCQRYWRCGNRFG